ncbi:hypothetical protein [Singulisphaera acidiphila]|uniref:Cytochrome c domain-containing protein n=1 Tax=Singulisphaera acidiphila (strain ATCC BAA-1392 / DSM 18658 / VKM B-2454 / MOB10) TaxID=886293 RepID=L0DG83_SINAD|nr:hypothetical protein [Singulisphaera acidiphila]AGA28282.1 hypothetical protein Sinac_4063 [Singulisphaera acidiphila DSM 18658]
MTRRAIIYAVAAVLAPGIAFSEDAPHPYRPSDPPNFPSGYVAPSTFTFEQFLTILASPEITSVDDLVERLPHSYRENYVEIFDSRSPERSVVTPKAPRIVSYGNEAKVIVAFCGDPADQNTFNKIQILRFNDDLKRWEFYATTVPPAKNEKGDMVPLEKNPARCLGCHGRNSNPPGPIWDSYPLWSGTYGANRDILFLTPPSNDFNAVYREGDQWIPYELKEPKFRSQYLANKQTIKRYKLLREHVGNREMDRLSSDAKDQPNSTFTTLLLLRQSEALARAIRENPDLKDSRFAILASLTGKYDFDDRWNGPSFSIRSRKSGLAGITSVGFAYPIELFRYAETTAPNGPPPLPSQQPQRDFTRELASLKIESATSALERHVKLLDLPKATVNDLQPPINVEHVFFWKDETVEKMPRLMHYLEKVGVSVRSWALDFDKRLTNNDGINTFLNHLERRLWAEIIDESESPELLKVFTNASQFRPVPGTALVWGGRWLDSLENLTHEIEARRHVCDLLREETNKIHPVIVVPNYPLTK